MAILSFDASVAPMSDATAIEEHTTVAAAGFAQGLSIISLSQKAERFKWGLCNLADSLGENEVAQRCQLVRQNAALHSSRDMSKLSSFLICIAGSLPLILSLFLASEARAAEDIRAMVRMDDGVQLETFIYLPDDLPAPVVLMRTPYRFPGPGTSYYDAFAAALTERGYTFVLQNLRGRFGSEGEFAPFENAIEDGAATVRWIKSRPWSNGRIGTIGGSYNGFTALAAAAGSPDVQAVVADDPALDLWAGRRGGALGLLPVYWLYLLDHGAWPDEAAKALASNTPDPSQIDTILLGRNDPFWETYVAGHAGSLTKSLRTDIDRICAPVLILKSKSEGWEDPVDLWNGLHQTGCAEHRSDHRLIITAEGHTFHLDQFGTSETVVTVQVLAWLDHWLRDLDDPGLAPVLFRPGASEPFQAANSWPVSGAELSLYLGQQLSLIGNAHLLSAPNNGLGTHSLEIDPSAMSPCADYPNQTYLSKPLDQDVLVAGPMQLELFVRATTETAGLSAQVYDYDKDRTQPLEFVTFGVIRANGLEAATPDKLTIHMHSLSHRFREGSQIVLSLSGSACGYGEVNHAAGTYEILHGAMAPSRLVMEAVSE